MESKKINQLATELAPELSDLTIIGDPTTGISKKITLSQMASLFTGTVEEYANLASFPLVGTADTIYIALDTNIIYRWNTGTSAYVELSPNIVTSLVFNDANGFDGTISLVGSTATLTITTALTTGSVGFIGASGALTQDNSNFYWDNSNKRLGINTNVPTTALDVFGSGIIGRLNGTSTNNAFLGFASAGSNKWSIGNVQSDHRFRIYSEANAAELVSVLQTGEVGIGIANPLTKLHIFGGASALIANLDSNTSVAKSISFRSGNSSRINLEVSGTESGSNAGMNFFLRTYTDAGALIETPFQVTRSTGITTIKNLSLTNALSVSNGGTGATSLTSGHILFGNGTNALTTTSNIFWDNASYRLGILNSSPTYTLDVNGITRISNDLYISGNVGIGTTSPAGMLDVRGTIISSKTSGSNTVGAGPAIYLTGNTGASYTYLQQGVDRFIYFGYNGTSWVERMTINNTTGNVGIGTSSPSTILDIVTNGNVNATFNSTATEGGYIRFQKSGTNFGFIGQSYHIVTGGSVGDMAMAANANMVFSTGSSLNERLRITNGGIVLINATSAINGNNAIFQAISVNGASVAGALALPNSASGGVCLNTQSVSSASTSWYHFVCQSGNGSTITTNNMLVYGNGNVQNTNNSYGQISDITLKKEITKATPKLQDLLKVNIVNFKFINDESETKQLGVIAQELEEIFPSMIDIDKDGLKSVKYSIFVPMLVKAIQEQQAQIEELKNK